MPSDSALVDPWSAWLLHGRDGGDVAERARIAEGTAGFAERILAAVPAPPAKMLDIGSGEGLMAWAALARWPAAQVICTDISAALLELVRQSAQARGWAAQCSFIRCGAEHLAGVADGGQDLVTSRSVLAYVADRPAAFRAAFRVLRPGGWLSIAEPLFREEALSACAMTEVLARGPNQLLGWLQRWRSAQFPATAEAMAQNPLTNFTEREMLQFAQAAGFTRLHLELHIDVQPALPRGWDSYIATAPHPLAPSLAQILETRFTAAERAAFVAVLRPEVEAGSFSTAGRMLYLSAQKPGCG